MAFVGAISDLFSCGRPRRPQTRETNAGDDATRVAATSDPASTVRTSADKGPIDTPLPSVSTRLSVLEEDLPPSRPAQSKGSADSTPSSTCTHASIAAGTVPDIEHAPEEVRQDRNERNKGSSDGRVKSGKGWQVEQRFIVITDTQATSDPAPQLKLDNVATAAPEVAPMAEAPGPVQPPAPSHHGPSRRGRSQEGRDCSTLGGAYHGTC